jgi:hypothetical protein
MNLVLTETEISVIRIWAESTIRGGHWGDGDFFIPEESILLRKLDESKGGLINLTNGEARMILIWSESSRGIYTMEEESAIGKLKSVLSMDL